MSKGIIRNTMVYLDRDYGEHLTMTYHSCGCGCGSVANFFIFESSIFEDDEPVVIEVADEFNIDLNPVQIVNDMVESFERDGLNFKLVGIESEIDDNWENVDNSDNYYS